ncbi:MAG: hypothetical protein ACYDB4_10160 [Candidatus Dormibacteraceae bacterium]
MDTTEDPQDRLTASMQELSQLVTDFVRTGKQATAAALKPQLQFRSIGVFSETALGFPNFRSFLREAESRGFVRLRAHFGGDLLVLPVEAAEQPSAELSSPSEPTRIKPIRQELWRAFFNWRPGFKRLYKLPSAEIYMFPEEPNPLWETAVNATLRAEWKASPELFVEIAPITQETQVRWMREFTEELPSGDAKQALTAALATTHPAAFFARLVMALPEAPAWKHFRLERVVAEIQEWAHQHQVTIDLFGRPTGIVAPATPAEPAPIGQPERLRSEELRRKILRAVEKMPLSDLLRISIPAEYWYE